MQFEASYTGTLEASLRVNTGVLTTAILFQTFVFICTVSDPVYFVALPTGTVVAARGVHTVVITRGIQLTLVNINTDPLVILDFEALWTNTFIAPFSVQTLVTASPIVNSAFVLI